MLEPKVAVPLFVLIIQIIVKIIVGKGFEKKSFLNLIFELPTSLIFIAFSFTLVCIFSNMFVQNNLIYQLLGIFGAILLIFGLYVECKRRNDLSKSRLNTLLIVLFITINLAGSGFLLFYSANNVLAINKKVPIENITNQDKNQIKKK